MALTGAGAGAAQAHNDPAHTGSAAHHRHHHHHHHGLARAAHALGVDKDALKAAVSSAREQVKAAGTTDRQAAWDAFTASVADQLGKTQDQVKAAFAREGDGAGCDHHGD